MHRSLSLPMVTETYSSFSNTTHTTNNSTEASSFSNLCITSISTKASFSLFSNLCTTNSSIETSFSFFSHLHATTHGYHWSLGCLILHFFNTMLFEAQFFFVVLSIFTLNNLILDISSFIPTFGTLFMLSIFLQIQSISLFHPILSTKTTTTTVKIHRL